MSASKNRRPLALEIGSTSSRLRPEPEAVQDYAEASTTGWVRWFDKLTINWLCLGSF